MALDKVHPVGMSENGSTFLTLDAYYGDDNQERVLDPPVSVVLEGKDLSTTAVVQAGLAARYSDEELGQIGEGNSLLGLKRVIGDIATNGNLQEGAIKPLHPGILEGYVVIDEIPAVASTHELTA